MKYFLIVLLVVSQLTGIFFIFQQQYVIAIICFSINALSLLILLLIFLLERLKDKKEEEENDYRDY